jgi:nicotinamidase/pyrazinamidase
VKNQTKKSGVIVVDFQADFTKFKNGSLAVEGTDEAYVKSVEENTRLLKAAGFRIFGTMDWHPANHISFFTSHKGKKALEVIKVRGKDQVLWPPHCIQDTPGAEVLLDKKLFKAFVKTATDPQFEGYSGFQDDGGKKTELDNLLTI